MLRQLGLQNCVLSVSWSNSLVSDLFLFLLASTPDLWVRLCCDDDGDIYLLELKSMNIFINIHFLLFIIHLLSYKYFLLNKFSAL